MTSLINRTRGLGLLGLALAGLLTLGGATGQAADPFVAGSRSSRALSAPPDVLARARDHGVALARALGLPVASAKATRVADVFDHRTYDEVTAVDAHGMDVALSRFDLDGSVAMALALGWHANAGRGLDGPAAAARAAAVARAAGLDPAGAARARESAGAGGWSVSWARVVDSVAVRGDGLRVALWPDGTFHALTRTERALAAPPDARLQPSAARAAAVAVVAGRLGSAAADLVAAGPDLAWIAPNDALGGPRLDAPGETLRLAWIVRFDAHGALADRLRAVEVWIDAGDGRLLGGDVAE